MAQEALKKLEEQLNCSVCLDTYTDPKQLQCNHVYCQKCVMKVLVQNQQGELVLTCPICRQDTPVPANGVAGLQSAFYLNHLLEIHESFKSIKDSPSSLEGAVDSATTTPSTPVLRRCFEHDEDLKLYCETCGELICYQCAIKGGKHYDHDYQLLKKAFDSYKRGIVSSLQPIQNQLNTITKSLQHLQIRCSDISNQQVGIELDINKSFRQLQDILDSRRTELIGQLHQITREKLKGLAVQRDQMETTQAQLSCCLEFVKKSLETGSEREVLMRRTNIVKQVKELTTRFQPDSLKPITDADITFSTLSDITIACCKKYGQILVSGSPDPSKCYATGKGVEETVVGETSTAVLQAINYQDQSCKEPIKSSEIELVSEITSARTRGSIERRRQSQYEISYQPTIKGRHQLHIKVEDQHIRGSPFSVTAKSSVDALGTPILTLGGVMEPWGVAISQRGEVMITERGADCVSVFGPSGERLRSFGTHGSCVGQFAYPCGVAVDSEGNILVADRDNNRIQKFTAEGQFLTAVGTKDSGPLQFNQPYGIAFNQSNCKVYVTDLNHHVQVLNSDLTFSCIFGKYGNGKQQFNNPCGVACDSTGKVYVVDSSNHRIQVFTAEGKFLRMFGWRGEGRGELDCPVGIAIDTSDMVYVSEVWNHRVSVFTSEGQFVSSFGGEGRDPGEFSIPTMLAIDDSGVLYVCDRNNHCVQCF